MPGDQPALALLEVLVLADLETQTNPATISKAVRAHCLLEDDQDPEKGLRPTQLAVC